MRTHTANELKFTGDILDKDGTTVLTAGVRCGLQNLASARRDENQATSSETSHVLLFRYPDAAGLTGDGYVSIGGVLYVVDARPRDPLEPQPGMWLEVDCHVERSGS